MKEKIACFLSALPLPPQAVILLACSGGGDSMCLWHILADLSQTMDFSLVVAHFNHQIRPISGQNDQDFVENQANIQNIPCTIGTANIPHLAKSQAMGLEACARAERYRFLQETAQICGAHFLATAHQAEDNIETFLHHFCRGTGLGGLSAIAPQKGNLIRPMLGISRKDIANYLKIHQIPHCQDETNQEERYRRNYIRHQILPKLETLNPQYVSHSVNTIGIIRQEDYYLQSLVEAQLPLECLGEEVRCQREDFLNLPEPLQGRALQYLVSQLTDSVILSFAQRKQALEVVKSSAPGGKLFLSSHLHLFRVYDTIRGRLGKMPKIENFENLENPENANPVPLSPGTKLSWHGWEISLKSLIYQGETVENTLYVTEFPLFVGTRRQGDVLKLPKRPHKSLKKYCIQEKIPQEIRATLPVFRSEDGTVVAVAMFGVTEPFLPKKGETALEIILTPPKTM